MGASRPQADINDMPLHAPSDGLEQVVFVHDYIQLVFGDVRISLYGATSVRGRHAVYEREEPGFCDALVKLMGQRAIALDAAADCRLTIVFASGETIVVLPTVGPEPWEYAGSGEFIVCCD
jgi:hypothetical protein